MRTKELKYNVGLTLEQFDEIIKLIDDDYPDEDILLEIRAAMVKTRTKLKEKLDSVASH